MNTKKEEVKVFREVAICASCGGQCALSGVSELPGIPPSYNYVCAECGSPDSSYVKYPKITYKKAAGVPTPCECINQLVAKQARRKDDRGTN